MAVAQERLGQRASEELGGPGAADNLRHHLVKPDKGAFGHDDLADTVARLLE